MVSFKSKRKYSRSGMYRKKRRFGRKSVILRTRPSRVKLSSTRANNRYGNAQAYISRSLMPTKKLVKLVFNTTITLNPPATGLASHRFASNDVYNPDVTTTIIDRKYRGINQLGEFYGAFTVIGSKIVTRWSAGEGHTAGAVFCGILNNPQNQSVGTDYSTLIEDGRTSYEFKAFDSDGSNTYPLVLTNNFSLKRDMSVTNPLDEPNLSSPHTASPSVKSYFDLICGSMNNTSDMPPVLVNVTMTAIIVCTKPKNIGQSN